MSKVRLLNPENLRISGFQPKISNRKFPDIRPFLINFELRRKNLFSYTPEKHDFPLIKNLFSSTTELCASTWILYENSWPNSNVSVKSHLVLTQWQNINRRSCNNLGFSVAGPCPVWKPQSALLITHNPNKLTGVGGEG